MFDMSVPWWELIVRGLVVYVFLIALLRLTGKRQIGQLSPFDLVLLLILSEAVQSSMVAGDESLIGGLIVATTLIAVNYTVGLITFKSKKLEAVIEGGPQVLIYHGKLYEKVMTEAKLTRQELDTTLRESGYFEIKDVKLAILENTGSVTVQGYDKK
jgi:uncharacterized membrane protein YcaP (DUF421 family)